jgi:hypothetical protein
MLREIRHQKKAIPLVIVAAEEATGVQESKVMASEVPVTLLSCVHFPNGILYVSDVPWQGFALVEG